MVELGCVVVCVLQARGGGGIAVIGCASKWLMFGAWSYVLQTCGGGALPDSPGAQRKK